MAQGKVIIVNYNDDYDETMKVYQTEEEAMKDMAWRFEVNESPDGKMSKAFLDETISITYDDGNWKGLNIQVLDLQSLSLDTFAPGCLDEDGPEPA